MRSFSMLTFAGARDPRVPALGSMEPFKICLFCSNSTNKFYATVTKLIFCPITYCNLQLPPIFSHYHGKVLLFPVQCKPEFHAIIKVLHAIFLVHTFHDGFYNR